MPIDYRQIQEQIQPYGDQLRLRQDALDLRRRTARERLAAHALELEALTDRVERAAEINPALRCAVPAGERLDLCVPLQPGAPPATLLAADGSQINPDRDAAVDYCVINVGAVSLRVGSGEPLQVTVRSQLLDVQELYTLDGLISEGTVALKRDLGERRLLAELAADAQPPVITLTDGPLELFREREPTREYDRALSEYLGVLEGLAERRVVTAGYVDRPRSDLVIRLLELADRPEDKLDRGERERPKVHLPDIFLFRDLLSTPGDRSAVFAIRSPLAQRFRGDLALHFFYLNVGLPERPSLARVEVPAWVCADPSVLAALQTVLLEQCHILSTRPYPYLLYRAHEVAEVPLEDKRRLDELLAAEVLRQRMAPASKSPKQSAKDMARRKWRRT